MQIGVIQPARLAIPEPEGLVLEEDRETVSPTPRQALQAGGIRLQAAAPLVASDLKRPESILDDSPAQVSSEDLLVIYSILKSSPLSCGLPHGRRQDEWNVQTAPHEPPDSELQRSAEPRRIWNRVYLALTLARLGQTPAQTLVTIENCNSIRPGIAGLLPEPDRHPVGAPLIQRETAGFPVPHEMTLEVSRFVPPAAIQPCVQIGPRSKVALPSIPRLSIVSA
jgi:hypothetical protein